MSIPILPTFLRLARAGLCCLLAGFTGLITPSVRADDARPRRSCSARCVRRTDEPFDLAPPARRAFRADLHLGRMSDLQCLQPDAQLPGRSLPREDREMGRDLRRSRPERRRREDARRRLQAEAPGGPRSARGLRPEDRRHDDARGVRDRFAGPRPLPRPDRRPVRQARGAKRESLG